LECCAKAEVGQVCYHTAQGYAGGGKGEEHGVPIGTVDGSKQQCLPLCVLMIFLPAWRWRFQKFKDSFFPHLVFVPGSSLGIFFPLRIHNNVKHYQITFKVSNLVGH
jgi:hypothetical protein